MSKTTVICLAGKRIEVRPSPTTSNHVMVQILTANREIQATITMTPDGAGVFADALIREGESAWCVEPHLVDTSALNEVRPASEGRAIPFAWDCFGPVVPGVRNGN